MSLGTPHYMSPEQAMGERDITPRSDVYALGVVLYEMLTGDPPFTGSTAQAVVARVLTEAPRPILPQRHTIPPEVEAAVLTALEKLPADRFGIGGGVRRGAGRARRGFDGAHRGDGREDGRAGREDAAGSGEDRAGRGAGRCWPRSPPGAGSGPGPRRRSTGSASSCRRTEALSSRQPVGQPGRDLPRRAARWCTSAPAQQRHQLWLREHDKLISTPISGTEGAGSPFFSPDGRAVGFLVGGTKLRVAPLDGGPTQTLSDSVNATARRLGLRTATSTSSRTRASRASAPPAGRSSRSTTRRAQGGRAPNGRRAARRQGPPVPDPPPEPGGRPTSRSWPCRSRTASRTCSCAASTHGTRPPGTCWSSPPTASWSPMPFDPASSRSPARRSGCSRGSASRSGGFSTNLALSATGTLVYTTGARGPRPAAGMGDPRGRGDAGGLHLAAAGHHRRGHALARRARPRRGPAPERNKLDLDQADPDRPLLAAHLRRHRQPAAHLVRRRPLAHLHRQRAAPTAAPRDAPARRRHRHRRRRWSIRPSTSRQALQTRDGKWLLRAARSSRPGRATSTASARATRPWCRS